jgi:hypothetical protein
MADQFSTNVETFLENYPEWSDISNDVEDGWSEDDHNLFREALRWLTQQKVNVIVSWSF